MNMFLTSTKARTLVRFHGPMNCPFTSPLLNITRCGRAETICDSFFKKKQKKKNQIKIKKKKKKKKKRKKKKIKTQIHKYIHIRNYTRGLTAALNSSQTPLISSQSTPINWLS